MRIEGGEPHDASAARGETDCRLCGVNRTRRLDGLCLGCDRTRYRVGGLTACCDVMPLLHRGKRYCPACPGDKVLVVLVSPDGRERESWHPPAARASGTSLEHLAKIMHCKPGELVLNIDERGWWTRQLTNAALRRKRTTKRMVEFRCERCDRLRSRCMTTKAPKYCKTCSYEAKRESLREIRKRYDRSHKTKCTSCERMKPCSRGVCSGCRRRAQRNGFCETHGRAKIRIYATGETRCLDCTPTTVGRAKTTLHPIEITDGETSRVALVTKNVKIAGHRAGAWIAPVMLVKDVKSYKLSLRSAVVVSGIAVDGIHSSTRSVLPLLEEVRSASEAMHVVTDTLGVNEARGVIARLHRAGMLDSNGLTPRARAVLAWCRSAGVKF